MCTITKKGYSDIDLGKSTTEEFNPYLTFGLDTYVLSDNSFLLNGSDLKSSSGSIIIKGVTDFIGHIHKDIKMRFKSEISLNIDIHDNIAKKHLDRELLGFSGKLDAITGILKLKEISFKHKAYGQKDFSFSYFLGYYPIYIETWNLQHSRSFYKAGIGFESSFKQKKGSDFLSLDASLSTGMSMKYIKQPVPIVTLTGIFGLSNDGNEVDELLFSKKESSYMAHRLQFLFMYSRKSKIKVGSESNYEVENFIGTYLYYDFYVRSLSIGAVMEADIDPNMELTPYFSIGLMQSGVVVDKMLIMTFGQKVYTTYEFAKPDTSMKKSMFHDLNLQLNLLSYVYPLEMKSFYILIDVGTKMMVIPEFSRVNPYFNIEFAFKL